MKLYFSFKLFFEYILPLGLLAIIILFILALSIRNFFEKQKDLKVERYLESIGYRYENRRYWETKWKRASDGAEVTKDELSKLSLREIKKRYK